MKRATIIVLSVAILGLIGLSNSKNKAKGSVIDQLNANTSSSQTATPSNANAQSTSASNSAAGANYKDGTFTGAVEDTPYGPVQVAAVISGGKITNINFLQMPSDQHESMQRTMFASPVLKQSAISNQSANIDFVSGATDTSIGFKQSLQAALDQAAI